MGNLLQEADNDVRTVQIIHLQSEVRQKNSSFVDSIGISGAVKSGNSPKWGSGIATSRRERVAGLTERRGTDPTGGTPGTDPTELGLRG